MFSAAKRAHSSGKEVWVSRLCSGIIRGILSAVASAFPIALPAIVVHEEVGLTASLVAADTLQGHSGFAAAGWVEVVEGGAQFRGTGVLVADRWVLTAAHNWLSDSLTGLAFHHGGLRYPAVSGSWLQHPGWIANPQVGPGQGRDLAVFQLAVPVPGIVPATIYGGSIELGAAVTFFGAGSAGTGMSGALLNPDASLYAGTNVIDRVIQLDPSLGGGGLLAFDFDNGSALRNSMAGSHIFNVHGQMLSGFAGATIHSRDSDSTISVLEATSAPGDSGGPVFADFGAGPELVGIFSWGVNPTEPGRLYGSGYGDVAYLTRLSDSREWVLSAIPEPAHFALIFGLLGISPLIFRKRRSFELS